MPQFFRARQWLPLVGTVVVMTFSSTSSAGLPKPGELPVEPQEIEMVELPKPGELPKVPTLPNTSGNPSLSELADPAELLKVPEFPQGAESKMPQPGKYSGGVVACMQTGKMDITRPTLPLLSCWESTVAQGETLEDLQKACNVQMAPMKIKSTLVPKCMPKALGVCVGAINGSASGQKSTSDHYHYTPQTLLDWKKAKKNCEKAEGEWFGLGNPKSWF